MSFARFSTIICNARFTSNLTTLYNWHFYKQIQGLILVIGWLVYQVKSSLILLMFKKSVLAKLNFKNNSISDLE